MWSPVLYCLACPDFRDKLYLNIKSAFLKITARIPCVISSLDSQEKQIYLTVSEVVLSLEPGTNKSERTYLNIAI